MKKEIKGYIFIKVGSPLVQTDKNSYFDLMTRIGLFRILNEGTGELEKLCADPQDNHNPLRMRGELNYSFWNIFSGFRVMESKIMTGKEHYIFKIIREHYFLPYHLVYLKQTK